MSIYVLNNWGTKEEANFVAKWFATDEGQLYLGKRMDSEYSERKIKDVSSCSMTGKSIDTIFRNSQRKKRYLTVFRVAAVLIPFFILSGAIYLLNTNIDLLGTSNLKTVTTRKKETGNDTEISRKIWTDKTKHRLKWGGFF